MLNKKLGPSLNKRLTILIWLEILRDQIYRYVDMYNLVWRLTKIDATFNAPIINVLWLTILIWVETFKDQINSKVFFLC